MKSNFNNKMKVIINNYQSNNKKLLLKILKKNPIKTI